MAAYQESAEDGILPLVTCSASYRYRMRYDKNSALRKIMKAISRMGDGIA